MWALVRDPTPISVILLQLHLSVRCPQLNMLLIENGNRGMVALEGYGKQHMYDIMYLCATATNMWTT
ncbi:hypothetical protein AAZX31_06G074500 [Glycine max]